MSAQQPPPYALALEQLEREVEFQAFRASGPGGQHVNKTSSAVRLKHLPSGVVVVVDDTPSQFRNKALAFERLIGKLRLLNYVAPKRYATRPTRGSQERRLAGKRRDAAIKKGRGRHDTD